MSTTSSGISLVIFFKLIFNPFPAKFLKQNNPPYIFGTIHYQFQGYHDENLKLASHQYRAWSDCTDVHAGLALYWWQKLIIFGVGRIKVKTDQCKTTLFKTGIIKTNILTTFLLFFISILQNYKFYYIFTYSIKDKGQATNQAVFIL